MSENPAHNFAISLPPILTPHPCLPPASPFAQACLGASNGTLAAADVVYSTAEDIASLAIVLEPDVDRATAIQMLPLMMVAIGDCLGALMPPKVAIQHRWPRTVLVNGAAAGYVSYAAAPATSTSDHLTAPAPWIVVGAHLSLLTRASVAEPGETPDTTSLTEEGAPEDLPSAQLLSSLSAHFLTWLDIWTTKDSARRGTMALPRRQRAAPGEVMHDLAGVDLSSEPAGAHS